MKFSSVVLVTKDMEKAKKFYKQVMKLKIMLDLGVNVSFTNKIALQTQETWEEFTDINSGKIIYRGNSAEIYLEENNFDGFMQHLKTRNDVNYVHGVKEYPWGQRVIRFYDPDGNIIEVGENMEMVCIRFLKQNLSVEEVSKRTMFPVKYLERLQKKILKK